MVRDSQREHLKTLIAAPIEQCTITVLLRVLSSDSQLREPTSPTDTKPSESHRTRLREHQQRNFTRRQQP